MYGPLCVWQVERVPVNMCVTLSSCLLLPAHGIKGPVKGREGLKRREEPGAVQ